MFDPKDYYISISRNAGKDIRRILQITDISPESDDYFDKIRGELVSGIANSTAIGDKETHLIVSVRIFGKLVGLWCIVKDGSPGGIQDHTVTVAGVVSEEDLLDVFLNARKNKDFLFRLYNNLGG